MVTRFPHVFTQCRLTWFWIFVAIVSIGGIFVLPLSFPPSTPLFSSSYEVGFNNRVATLATALISVAVALLLWWVDAGASIRKETRRMPIWWLGAAFLAAIAHTAILGTLVVRADVYYGDAGYFLNQLTHSLYDPHAAIYRDIEFAYGPLLFYWPMLFIKGLGHAGVGPEAAYMVSLALMQVAGLALVFYILDKLPLSRTLQGIALATLTFGSLTALLGLNYTMFRFMLPHAAILWIASAKTVLRQAVLFALGEVLMLAVSPELGIAFGIGAVFVALYATHASGARWMTVAIAPTLGFAVFAACTGRDYFYALKTFAAGSYNSVVDPTRGHIDILILAAVALCPMAVVGVARNAEAGAGGIVGMYGASLAMLPSALGRCDALHTFFSGIGLVSLALVAVEGSNTIWRRGWVTLFISFSLWSQATQMRRLAPDMRNLLQAHSDRWAVDLVRLQALTHGERVASPIDLPQSLRWELMREGQYEPGYFCNLVQVTQPVNEKLIIAEMARTRYTLIPTAEFTMQPDITSPNNRRFGYRYKLIHPPYVVGELIKDELRSKWILLSRFQSYTLYRRR